MAEEAPLRRREWRPGPGAGRTGLRLGRVLVLTEPLPPRVWGYAGSVAWGCGRTEAWPAPGPRGKSGSAVHKTSMEPWAPAEPAGSPVILEERLNLLPALNLRQELPPPRVSKSFLSTSQARPIPSDLGTRNPSSPAGARV